MNFLKYCYFATVMFSLFFNSIAWTAAQERPLFSREEISNPKGALKAVSKILDGRIRFNQQFDAFISDEAIEKRIRQKAAAAILMPNHLEKWSLFDLIELKRAISHDLTLLQTMQEITIALIPLSHHHCGLLWFHVFEALSAEKYFSHLRLQKRNLGGVESEHETFFTICSILKPFLNKSLKSQLEPIEKNIKTFKEKDGILSSKSPIRITALEMVDESSLLSYPEAFFAWGLNIRDQIAKENPHNPILKKIEVSLKLADDLLAQLYESKVETKDNLTHRLLTLFKIENTLVQAEASLKKEGKESLATPLVMPSSSSEPKSEAEDKFLEEKMGLGHLEMSKIQQPGLSLGKGRLPLEQKSVTPDEGATLIPDEVQSLPPVLEQKAESTQMDSPRAKAEPKGKGKNQNIALGEEEEQPHSLAIHLDRGVKQPSVKKIEPSSAPQTPDYSHIIEELTSSKTLKFRKAIDLLNQMNIKVGQNLLTEDPSDKTPIKKGNGTLCMRVPHKNSQQDYSLRFFHTPHASEDNTGQRAFWRIAIKDALTEAGWMTHP